MSFIIYQCPECGEQERADHLGESTQWRRWLSPSNPDEVRVAHWHLGRVCRWVTAFPVEVYTEAEVRERLTTSSAAQAFRRAVPPAFREISTVDLLTGLRAAAFPDPDEPNERKP